MKHPYNLLQGESLRLSLLIRYYGNDHMGAKQDGSKDGKPEAIAGSSSPVLSRAEMTLHDVQVKQKNSDKRTHISQ